MIDISNDSRFMGVEAFTDKVWLSSPTVHGDEQHWVDEAIQTNWVSTVGANIDEIERIAAEKIGRKYSVALSTGTAAIHLAVKLAKLDDDSQEDDENIREYVMDIVPTYHPNNY